MTYTPKHFFRLCSILVLANVIFLNGCQTLENSNTNSANNSSTSAKKKKSQASDNVEELLNLVKLPVVPADVVWSEEEIANNKKLTAVLQYETKDMPAILAVIEKYKQAEQSEVGVENWFPEELTAKAQLSGVETIKGIGYGANEFFNIPYGSGKITQIEGTNYLVLELQTN